ncbi:Protein of unknown function [Gryllus bimaculatus]|nr:Protein of unknown function [Gryllus bimaculatus]
MFSKGQGAALSVRGSFGEEAQSDDSASRGEADRTAAAPWCCSSKLPLGKAPRVDKGSAVCCRGVTLVAPAVAAPGRTTAVLVSLRGAAAPVNVSLRLVSDRVEEATQLLASAQHTVRDNGYDP